MTPIYIEFTNVHAASFLHSLYAEAREPAVFMVKKSKLQSWENFGHKMDSNYWQPKNCSGKPTGVFAENDLIL